MTDLNLGAQTLWPLSFEPLASTATDHSSPEDPFDHKRLLRALASLKQPSTAFERDYRSSHLSASALAVMAAALVSNPPDRPWVSDLASIDLSRLLKRGIAGCRLERLDLTL